MTLREKQSEFVRCVAKLINFASDSGYELTFGEAYRSDEQAEINALGPVNRERAADLIALRFTDLATKIRNNARGGGIRNSLHCVRLAIDLNLFRNGVYLSDTDSHAKLGAYWKSLHPDAVWGGDFIPTDGNHYALSHEGRK